jgi:hypothetical protein
MKNLIYGFETDLSKYELKQILLWMLISCIGNLIVGVFIEKKNQNHMYFYLIRLKKYSKGWYKLCSHILMISIVWTVFLFGSTTLVIYVISKEVFYCEILPYLIKAFFLSFLNFFSTNMVRLFLSYINIREKLSFAGIVVVQVTSLYFGIVSEKMASWLPGSYMMYYRSNFYTNTGFLVWVSTLVQVSIVLTLFLLGTKLVEIRRN